MRNVQIAGALLAWGLVVTVTLTARPAVAGSEAAIDRDVSAALTRMYDSVPNSRDLGGQARGILVFPNVVKAGFLFGAQYGEGALRSQGRTTGYYNTVSASYGLQAGVQVFGYALFFMSDSALQYLNNSGGFDRTTSTPCSSTSAGSWRVSVCRARRSRESTAEPKTGRRRAAGRLPWPARAPAASARATVVRREQHDRRDRLVQRLTE